MIVAHMVGRRLKQSFYRIGIFYLAIHAATLVCFAAWLPASYGIAAAGVSTVLAVLWLTLVRRNLSLNRCAPDAESYPTVGAANTLTLLRGLLVAHVAAFAVSPRLSGGDAWLPAILYTLSLVLDYLDGFVARRTHRQSLLGAMLEGELDSAGVLAASVYAVEHAGLAWWFLLVGCARYLFVAAAALRRRMGGKTLPLRHSASGRAIAGLMMGFLSAALWPIVPTAVLASASIPFTAVFVGGFIRDWCAISGWVDFADARFAPVRRPTLAAVGIILPMCARCAYAAASVFVSGEVRLVVLGAGLLTLLGFAGRTASLVGVAVAVLLPRAAQSSSADVVALVWSCVVILFCGTGPLSLWAPEARLFARR